MTFEQIIEQIRKKIYHPVYLLHGEEPYFIDRISDLIEETVLSDTEKEFNQTVLYGRDTTAGLVIDVARRFPMMSNYQVVIVKEAQDLEKIEDLQYYLEKPLPSTILVIDYKYKKIDQRKSFAKLVDKTGVLFESARIYPDKVPAWITEQIRARGYSIQPQACQMLSEYLGNDLGRIINEIEKLVINLPAGSTIDGGIIEKNIGISKEYNIFELQGALGRRDVLKANRIINYFAANPKVNPAVVVITVLFNFFMKLMIYHQLEEKTKNSVASALSVNPFFVKDYEDAAQNYSFRKLRAVIAILREYDLRLKGINNGSADEAELIKEMVWRILH
jgi:DNA polymerase III subunit delta